MIDESKIRNYLIYAIEEIILVVIGILLALQINTWNENKKARVFKIKMLTAVRNALESDKQFFEYNISYRMNKIKSEVTVFLDLINENRPFHDSITSSLAYLDNGIQYQYNKGPYDAIKTTGMDKISNDSLRKTLMNMYDFRFWRNTNKSVTTLPSHYTKLHWIVYINYF